MRRPRTQSRATNAAGRPGATSKRKALPRLRTRRARFSALGLLALGIAGGALAASATGTATPAPPALNLKILLIGNGASDPTTAAWESALTNEGVPYTEVDATNTTTAGSWDVTLPALTTGTTGNFNGVVIADSPSDFAAGQLTSLDTYETQYNVRQLDGYVSPSSTLGVTDAAALAPDGTTSTLTAAGLAAFPSLAGSVTFATGSYAYPATVNAGAPFTSWINYLTGPETLGGVYQHPATDAQANVQEGALFFDYNAAQLQWEIMAPSLISWVTNNAHLGLDRNYISMDIDDTFTPDNAWSTTLHDNDYSDAGSLRMSPADVIYAANWSKANNFRMDQLYNGGGSVEYQGGLLALPGDNAGPDPLLAQFQATDPTTGKSYAADFGWLSHTYDTPYLDVGCATQNYIEAELNENTNWAAAAPGTTLGTGGLGLTESTNTANALGYENPQVFVPGNHSGFADLVPGTPATVDPPDLDSATAGTGGSLAAGSYQYAVTDQFNGADSPSVDESQAYVTSPVSVSAGGSVSLVWQAICHAANYRVYREVAGSNNWTYVGNLATPDSATLPDNSSLNPASTTDVTGGGEAELTYTDTGAAGTPEPAGWTPPVVENAVELPWEQNPYFIPALEAVGITTVGADASKAYPNPATDEFGIGATYTGATFAPGQAFTDGTAEVAPRHPINIFYNASTEAQEVDEYNTLYDADAPDSQCHSTSVTTCSTTPFTFADVINQVTTGMLQNMLSNDPRPSYVHQTNIMGSPPAGAATTGTPPATADTTGDGLLYSVLNPLLAEYHSYFNATTPYEQPTLGAIGTVLANQTAWQAALSAGTVTATDIGGTIVVKNTGTTTINAPITAPSGTLIEPAGTAFGSAYAGTLSDWVSLPAGGSVTLNTPGAATTATAPTFTSTSSATSTVGKAFSFTVTTTGTPTAALTETGALPSGITFTDNGNGTATIAGTAASGTGGSYPITITATNSAGAPTQTFTLTNDQAPAFTSASSATSTVGKAFSFTVTTTGTPTAALTETGALPKGITFTAKTNGTATIAGTATSGTIGIYRITIKATNSIGAPTQIFTLRNI